MRDSQITGKERLEHIKQAIADIWIYTKDASKETFLKDVILIISESNTRKRILTICQPSILKGKNFE